MWPVDEFTYSVRQNTHGNLSTNVILGIILIAAVGDAATCSPTGSKLQRVPADLLDMWAICLLVVALVSLHLIHMQTHTHTDCCYAHVCIHTYTIVLHLHHCTHRSPLNVTHCVCVEGWYRVLGFSLNRASLFFLRDKVQGQSSLPIIESGSLSNLWSCCSEGASGKMLREKGDVIRINSSDCCL